MVMALSKQREVLNIFDVRYIPVCVGQVVTVSGTAPHIQLISCVDYNYPPMAEGVLKVLSPMDSLQSVYLPRPLCTVS